jgi:hypothetical protein
MDYFAGLDISMDETHVCVLDREGAVVRESKAASTGFGRSYTLNMMGGALTTAHAPYPRPGFAPGLSFPTFKGSPHSLFKIMR